MTKLKLSIVVPVYNIEKDLPSCLDSILMQDFEDYELLLINDGSTDTSGAICDNHALKDNRIKVYHQKNAGVSAARNLGIEKAQGEWVCFVDGDDTLYFNSLSIIINKTNTYKLEMIIAKSFIFKSRQTKTERYKFDKTFLDKNFDGYKLITEKSYKRGSVCGCLFKLNFLKENKLYFPIGLKNGEDSLFMSLVYLYAKDIFFQDQIFYLVNEREGSASRSWSFERVYKMVDNIQFINSYIENHPNLNEKQKHILDYSIYGVISSIFNSLYYCFSISNYLRIFKAVSKVLKSKLNSGNIVLSSNKIKMLNFSLFLFSFTVLINQKIRQKIK